MKKIFTKLFCSLVLVSSLNAHAQKAPVLKLNDPLPANLFVELGKAINPAVVNISTSVIPKQSPNRDPMLDMLEQFYGVRPQGRQQQLAPGRPQRYGLGTGFIIREDGLIVTNAHVIQGADIIEVQLSEGSDKLYKAELIGQDERTDIALIKIKPDGKEKLTAAALGSSDELQVGEWVAAFGNPFGHGHSMTKGIISSKGREIGEINRLPLIQTDASINPGNSGGPLVNSKGLVIGVNSAIDARAQGIGFAIPIDEVKKIIPELEARGSIRKGYLGVALGDIDDYTAMQMDLGDFRGAVVVNTGEGPAKKAGIKIYDVITEFNGKKVRSSRDLSDMVAAIEPGKKVPLKVLRGEKTISLTATIEERPEDRKLVSKEKTAKEPELSGQKAPFNIGIEISDANKQIRERFGIDSEIKRPVITAIRVNTLATRIGLNVGDVILSINKVEPNSAKEALNAFKKGTNTIKVGRGRGMSVISFDIP